jgi:hypothetical protein
MGEPQRHCDVREFRLEIESLISKDISYAGEEYLPARLYAITETARSDMRSIA